MIPRKGHELLIEALASIPETAWHLSCVGSLVRHPDIVERLGARVTAAGLDNRITFAGEMTASELDVWYDRADVFVLATMYEGYGMAVAEALARGLPIVSTQTGDIPRITGNHGASALLPALPAGTTKYRVTFTHSLFTWDSYNTDPEDGHTGYWDSFSVSVSGGAAYAALTLTDPLTGLQTLASGTSFNPGFVWGGNDFDDSLESSTLECNPGTTPCLVVPSPALRTDTMTGSTTASNYNKSYLNCPFLPITNLSMTKTVAPAIVPANHATPVDMAKINPAAE